MIPRILTAIDDSCGGDGAVWLPVIMMLGVGILCAGLAYNWRITIAILGLTELAIVFGCLWYSMSAR